MPEAFELVHVSKSGWSHRTTTHKICIYVHMSVLCQICSAFAEIFEFLLKEKYDPLCSHEFELLALINHEMSLCSVN